MAKGNSVKGGAKAAKATKGAKGKVGKTKNVKRRGKPEKGARGEPGKQSFGKGAGVPGGKQKKKNGGRHRQLSGVAPDPVDADDDSDIDEGTLEGLKEYAGYSNFLLDMDVNELKEPTKPTAPEPESPKAVAPAQESRREKKKRKAEQRDTARAGGMDRGSDEEPSEGEDEEADYESRPRKAQKWDQKKAEALPVRSADGKWSIPDRPKPDPSISDARSGDSTDSSEDGELEDEMDDEAAEQAAAAAEQRIRQARKVAADPRLAEMARYQARQQGIAEAREAIAKLCAAIVENPEESGHRILALHEFYPDGDPNAGRDRTTAPLENCSVVKKMLLLSQLAVFKDIVPGYKIRILSEGEQKLKVTKEVRAQRDYENMLLSMYQRYLQRLHAVASALNRQKSTKAQVSLGVIAVKCLADLLQSLHHFNYSTNIVSTLIPMLDSPREEVVQLCTSVVTQLFKREPYSAAVVTAVRTIDQYAQKRKYRMQSAMFDCLLHLRLTEDADEKLRKLKNQQKKEQKEKSKKKGAVAHQTDAELERDMAESAAVMDAQSRRLAQAAMLRAMFLSYFRVLKSPRRLGPGVLRATLAGLGHFSHLISIDFLGDLFTCLNTLLRQGGVLPQSVEEDLPPPPAFDDDDEMEGDDDFKLNVTDALTACHAAMTLLSGERGETLEIDPQTTCTALYFLLPRLSAAEFDNLIPKALDSLRLILLQRRQLSMQRVGAFLKALISLAASSPMPHSSISILAFSRQLLMRYPKVRRLLESVDEGQQTAGGVVGLGLGSRGFRTDVEPDHANALESTAWELSCLIKHWHPHVRDASQGLLAENGGTGRSSAVLASAPGAGGVNLLWNTYNVSEKFGFIPSFPPAPRGKIAPSWQRDRSPLPALAGVVDEPLSGDDEPPCFKHLGWSGKAGMRGEIEEMAAILRGYRSFIARTELTVSKR